MKLSIILAAASLLAAPAAAVAQAHGGIGMGGGAGHAGPGAAFPARGVALAQVGPGRGAGHGGFHGGIGHHPGFHDRFHDRFDHRTVFVGDYPFWGWDCADGCDWNNDDPPDPTPANYAEAPIAPPGYAATAASPPRAEVNECSDWVWRAKLRRSVCVQPFRG